MIREAVKSDLRHCAEILSDCLMWDRYGRSFEDALSFFSVEYETGSEVWVFEENGTVLGYLVLIPRGMMGEFPFVRALGVLRNRRGTGIGSQLLEFAEERMFRLKQYLFMMVSDFNNDAQRLYYRLGFEKIGEIPDYKKEGIAEYVLVKRKDEMRI